MLDNAYENYVKNILELDSKLKLQPTFESIMIYLYEIQGYFRHVDVAKIFRLMLK
jgi:exportin-7